MRSILTFILALASLPVWAASTVCLQGVQYNPLRTEGASVQLWVRPGDPRNTLNGQGISQLTDLSGLGHHLVQSTAANQPQITRSDNKGNLLVQSESFETTWSRSGINAFGSTDTAAAAAGSFANSSRTTDPVGGNTADFIQEDGANAAHLLTMGIATTVRAAFSCYLKASGRSWAALQLGPGQIVYIDTQNGVIGGLDGGTAAISNAGNGWWFCSYTTTAAMAGINLKIYLCSASGVAVYQGDNTSGLFLWGASLRPASWDPDYIATTTLPAYAGARGQRLAYFDGVNDYLKSAAFTLNQPETVIGVFRQWTWTANDRIFDGNTADTGTLYQRTATPNMGLYAGAALDNNGLAVGSLGVAAATLNGANSSIRFNLGAPTIGDIGAANMGGFTLGAAATGATPANIQTGEIVVFQGALSDAWQNYNIVNQARLYGISIY